MKTKTIIMTLAAIAANGAANGASGPYVGIRGDYTMANFNKEYALESDPSDKEAYSFSMKPHIGADAAVGYRLSPSFRAELNYWYGGSYGDKDEYLAFDIGWHAFTLNGIYTIKEWTTTSIYGGLGIGAGMLGTKFTALAEELFDPAAETKKTSLVLAANLQLGIEEKVADGVYVGLSYRLGYMAGHTQKILLDDGDTFIVKNGGVLTNTVGLGIRYAF